MITHTTEGFEYDVEISLVVDGTGEVDVAEVARVGVGVDVAHSGIVDAAVDGLAVDGCFIAGDAGWDFAGVDGECLGD